MKRVYITWYKGPKDKKGTQNIASVYATEQLAIQAVDLLRRNRDFGDPDVKGYEWGYESLEVMNYVPGLSK